MLDEKEAYVALLVDALKKKKDLLTLIYEKTKEQTSHLNNPDMRADEFQEILKEKGEAINEIGKIDDGFDAIFQRVEEEIHARKEHYRSQILVMQSLIKEVTDLSMKVQALEKQNNEKFKIYLINEKSRIRDFKISKNTAASYYSSMSGEQGNDQSYFFNRTK